MKKDLGILWFRHDLRLHDNEALEKISAATESFLPVYVFDPRSMTGELPGGMRKMYRTRIQFLLDSIRDLRLNLRAKGTDLVVRIGKPEEVLYELAEKFNADGIYCNRERMPDEVMVQDALEERLWTLGKEMYYFRGKMLIHTSDLPFPIARTPVHYSSFLKETEHFIAVRRPVSSEQDSFRFPDLNIDPGPIPELSDFGYYDPFSNPEFKGGENSGRVRLKQMINQLSKDQGENLRISPWLSTGNLSAKHIYYEIDEAEQVDESLKRSLKRKLMLRDYYRLTGKKDPDTLFEEGGFRHQPENAGNWDESLLEEWIAGNTGHDYVDACMKCLSATGYLDHQARKAAAYFLIEEMKVHWLLGAGYFESVLLDYDPCSNYGNWQRAAGLSFDLKGRYGLNFELIGEQLDPDGSFRQKWAEYQVPKGDFRFQRSNL